MPGLIGPGINLVCDGNSITAGDSSGHAQAAYPAQLALQLNAIGLNCQFTNIGVSGQTTLQMLADGSTQVPALFRPSMANVLIVSEGGNGILLNNESAQRAYDLFVSYCVNRRSEGWYVVTFGNFTRSEVPGWGTNAQFEARLLAYNQLCSDNWQSFCNCYVDVRRALPMIISGNQYMPDGVHPSATGYALMAIVLAREVAKLRVR